MAHGTNSATTNHGRPATIRLPWWVVPRAMPYDVAGPVHIVGLDDQFESVGNIERAEYFKRSPDRRQASYGAADGSASAQRNRSSLQNTPSRCLAVFVHGGRIEVESKISINPAIPRRPVNGSLSPPANQAVGDSTWDILHRIRTADCLLGLGVRVRCNERGRQPGRPIMQTRELARFRSGCLRQRSPRRDKYRPGCSQTGA
jgi:hypothetical protein